MQRGAASFTHHPPCLWHWSTSASRHGSCSRQTCVWIIYRECEWSHVQDESTPTPLTPRLSYSSRFTLPWPTPSSAKQFLCLGNFRREAHWPQTVINTVCLCVGVCVAVVVFAFPYPLLWSASARALDLPVTICWRLVGQLPQRVIAGKRVRPVNSHEMWATCVAF